MRILLVEDDALIARDVMARLKRDGYLVDHQSNGEEAWFLGDTEDYSAVILDLGLPGLDGLTVLRRWRENGRTMPVIILTARGNWTEKVTGIDAGADDYLPKPFQMEELLARLRAVVRRSAGQASPIVNVGELRVDTAQKTVTVSGNSIDLTPMEFRCLTILAMRPGEPVSQMELTEHLYAQDFDRESNSVEVLVGRLRKKIGKRVIRTKRGFGYFLESADA